MYPLTQSLRGSSRIRQDRPNISWGQGSRVPSVCSGILPKRPRRRCSRYREGSGVMISIPLFSCPKPRSSSRRLPLGRSPGERNWGGRGPTPRQTDTCTGRPESSRDRRGCLVCEPLRSSPRHPTTVNVWAHESVFGRVHVWVPVEVTDECSCLCVRVSRVYTHGCTETPRGRILCRGRGSGCRVSAVRPGESTD